MFFAAASVIVAAVVAYQSTIESKKRALVYMGKSSGGTPVVTLNQYQVPRLEPRAFQPLGPASALALNAREPEPTVFESNCSILLRELARQAVLIAARESLGVPTRDCTLREGSLGAVLDVGAVAPNFTGAGNQDDGGAREVASG